MDNAIFTTLKGFVLKQACLNGILITRDTIIYKDLGITGDDAYDLIIAFRKKFNVDVSNYMFADYFEPEGMNWLVPHTIKNKKALTIGHLEKAIQAGRLDESIIHSGKLPLIL
jgi:acyl carrier protein